MSNDPAWLENDAASEDVASEWEDPNTTTERNVASESHASFAHARKYSTMQADEKEDFHRILTIRGFAFMHIASASLMYAACIVSFMRSPGFGEFFIAIYTSLFATILAAYELSRAYQVRAFAIQLCPDTDV
jgi:hypothetical protein